MAVISAGYIVSEDEDGFPEVRVNSALDDEGVVYYSLDQASDNITISHQQLNDLYSALRIIYGQNN